MTLLFLIIAIVVASLLGLLIWSSGRASSKNTPSAERLSDSSLECRHFSNFQQLKQIFDVLDIRYLKERAHGTVSTAVQQERRIIALKFLHGLREDFLRLQEASSIVAAMSPEVDAQEEWRRFWLTAAFRVKFVLLRIRFATGLPTSTAFQDLAWLVSSVAMEFERSIKEIAARAALAEQQNPSSHS